MSERSSAIEIEGLWKRFYKGGNEGLLWLALSKALRRMLSGETGRADTFWALQDIDLKVRRGGRARARC